MAGSSGREKSSRPTRVNELGQRRPLRDIEQIEVRPQTTRPGTCFLAEIKELLASRGQFVLGDHPREVFGAYLGRVRTKVARTAVKQLYAERATATDGVSHGQKLEDMVIRPAP